MESKEIYAFRIFVTGESLRSQRAIDNLRGLCAAVVGGAADIEVVDVLISPERAEQEKVIATPTVLRLSPAPARRVIGDLADFHLAAAALGLQRSGPPPTDGHGDDRV
jgi:circadian clock protein KaiB